MIELSWLIFIVQLVSSFMMIGIAWLIQTLNYPLFKHVPESFFKEYHQKHLNHSQWVIIPLMLLEMASAAYLLLWPLTQVKYSLYIINFILILLVWLQTFLLQVPAHKSLQIESSHQRIDRLIRLNWLRTITWTLHGVVLIFILY